MSHALARKRALRSLGRKLRLGTGPLDTGLLDIALTHDSYAAERARDWTVPISNERLEFLGDAILGAAVAHALYDSHPDKAEGALSRMRAALVSRAALAQTAGRMGIPALLLLGKGESAAGGAHRPSILAGAFEALVGAVYLSQGLDAAQQFVVREHLSHATPSDASDPKTALQEYAQAKFKEAPRYSVAAQVGPPHARTFTVAVEIRGQTVGSGSGQTKKKAESAAARQALGNVGRRPQRI